MREGHSCTYMHAVDIDLAWQRWAAILTDAANEKLGPSVIRPISTPRSMACLFNELSEIKLSSPDFASTL